MTGTPEDRIEDYLRRLSHELRDLPRAARREVTDDVAGHIAEARAEGAVEADADVLNMLDRIGAPDEIAAEARERYGVRSRGGGAREIAAIVLLLVGGFVFVVGWFVGLVLLWASEAWTTRDKLIGTFVVPFGLAPALWLATGTLWSTSTSCLEVTELDGTVVQRTCEGGPSATSIVIGVVVFVVVTLGPIFTSVYLARRMRKPGLPTSAVPTVTTT